MCLILIAVRAHAEFPLILAANRDEFFARPTLPAAPWVEDPYVLGGRDLEKGGTWLAVAPAGRLAAVTNYRDGGQPKSGSRSRGLLVSDFVLANSQAVPFLAELAQTSDLYDGFNLIVADATGAFHYSNRNRHIIQLNPGVHGLSNHLLNTPWPKVERGKAALGRLLDEPRDSLVQGLFEALRDAQTPSDEMLPDTGVSLDWERRLSTAFISASNYGTRASTVVLIDRFGTTTLIERSFGPDAQVIDSRTLALPGERVPAT